MGRVQIEEKRMKNKKKMRGTEKRSLVMIPVAVVLFAYVLSVVAVLGWGFLTSLKCVTDFTDFGNVIGLPDLSIEDTAYTLAFGNYIDVFASFGFTVTSPSYVTIWGVHEGVRRGVTFFDLLFNSFMLAGLGVFINVFTRMTVAYMCAKYKYKFSKILYTIVFVLMILPVVGTDASALVIQKTLGLYDNWVGMVITKIGFGGLYFLIFHAYFETLPNDYFEAAELDGASQLTCYLKIAIPLSSKIFSTVFLILFIESWNNYQTSLMYFPTHPTLAYGIYRMSQMTQGGEVGSRFSGIPVRVAGCMILALPVVILFSFFSDKLLGNLTMGGVKG